MLTSLHSAGSAADAIVKPDARKHRLEVVLPSVLGSVLLAALLTFSALLIVRKNRCLLPISGYLAKILIGLTAHLRYSL